MQLTVANESPL